MYPILLEQHFSKCDLQYPCIRTPGYRYKFRLPATLRQLPHHEACTSRSPCFGGPSLCPCLDLVLCESPLVSLSQRQHSPSPSAHCFWGWTRCPNQLPGLIHMGLSQGPWSDPCTRQAAWPVSGSHWPAKYFFHSITRLSQQNGAHMILSDSKCFAWPEKRRRKSTGLRPCTLSAALTAELLSHLHKEV